jgi:HAE1 family hydrophobic/amphiphilic exporter-1
MARHGDHRLAMPVSLIPTFIFMAIGLLAQRRDPAGLTLVIGILVDDAIVEIENIEKRVATGERPYRPPWSGPTPSAWRSSPPPSRSWRCSPPSPSCRASGQFFKEFGLTVSVAVLFSLLVARLLTPLLAAYFLKPSTHRRSRAKHSRASIRSVLEWALDHRIVACIIGGDVCRLDLLASGLPTGFQPPGNANYSTSRSRVRPAPRRPTWRRASSGHQACSRPARDRPRLRPGRLDRSPPTVLAAAAAAATCATAPSPWCCTDKRELTGCPRSRPWRETLRIPDVRVNSAQRQRRSRGADHPDRRRRPALERAALAGTPDARRSRPSPIRVRLAAQRSRDRHPASGRRGRASGRLDRRIAAIARVATVGDIDANVAKLTDGERRLPIRVRLPKPDPRRPGPDQGPAGADVVGRHHPIGRCRRRRLPGRSGQDRPLRTASGR